MPITLLDSGWDRALVDAVNGNRAELRLMCPFIKHRAATRLLRADQRPRIQVVTRFNLADFCSGVSDTAALRWLLEHGAEIRGVKALHAKLYLFGDEHALVTSANLTEAALLRNHEFGFVSKDHAICRGCREYFDRIWDLAGPNLTIERLDEWDAKLAEAVAGGMPPSRETGLPDEGVDVVFDTPGDGDASAWRLTLPPLVSEVDQAFVKFLGTAGNRAPVNMPVIDELRGSGCHWACAYPAGKRPRIVQDGAVMFIARLLDDGDIMVFGRAVALRHVPKRDDATNLDIEMRDWKEQWPHYIRVHHGEFVSGTLQNGIRLSELRTALGAQCFATTKARAAAGEQHVDPRRAYGKQAAVRLSNEGYLWLATRLELAFRQHGKVSPKELATLDWPTVHKTDLEGYIAWSIRSEGRKETTAKEYARFLERLLEHYSEDINPNTVPNEAAADKILGRIMDVVRVRGRWIDGSFNERDVTQNVTPALRAYGRYCEARRSSGSSI